ncbi:hypothetical protein [Ruegeria arenilitoris]|uniref:hypothetical protein n=1 Tax=Ruegeria arenilitoris TaxID=1173585 RepID=UPI00147FB6D2|nr:hypothetical protein [Ruegeria arenilitoris]
MKSLMRFSAAPLMAPPDAGGPAGFTTKWHGHGSGHQANNNPGDTAADRHNFGDAPAGKSNHKPTQGSAQDDFSAVATLDIGEFHHGAHTDWDMMG